VCSAVSSEFAVFGAFDVSDGCIALIVADTPQPYSSPSSCIDHSFVHVVASSSLFHLLALHLHSVVAVLLA